MENKCSIASGEYRTNDGLKERVPFAVNPRPSNQRNEQKEPSKLGIHEDDEYRNAPCRHAAVETDFPHGGNR